jgi:uncharacterized protein
MRVSSAVSVVPVFAIAALLALGACGGNTPSRYYFLSALPEAGGAGGAPGGASTAERGVAVGVGPVRLPDYLNRPQIVTRSGPNEFQVAEFNQWGGPLEAEFSRVLAENLSVLLPADRVAIFPWNAPYPAQYRVQVTVARFEADASGEVGLVARWSVVGKDGKEVLRAGQANFREPAGKQDYEATVAAMSRVLGGLSREIAAALRGLPPGGQSTSGGPAARDAMTGPAK